MHTMKNIILITCLLLVLAASSCQKQITDDLPPAASTQLTGTWKYLNTHVSGESTIEIDDAFGVTSSVTSTDYTTINNKGTLTIDDTKMTTDGVAYDVSTIATAVTYQDGAIVDSFQFPINFSLPPSSAVSAYKRIGTDSIYSETFSSTQIAGTSSGTQGVAGGYKYRIAGDTLFLATAVDQFTVDSSQGVPIKSLIKANVQTMLSRQ